MANITFNIKLCKIKVIGQTTPVQASWKTQTRGAGMLKDLITHMQKEAVSADYNNLLVKQYQNDSIHNYNTDYTQTSQRVLDLSISILVLLGFALFLPIIAILIKLDSKGPIFYTQTRIGQNRRQGRSGAPGSNRRKVIFPGRPFLVWKLRTMHIDAEKNGPQWATPNDMRITRLGRFLRKSRIDELPQFWNVLNGDMSVVGPRPERLCFIRKLQQDVHMYNDRLLVRPGITGLAQIENGYDTDLESVRKKVYLDRKYIGRISLRTDLSILMRTVSVVLTGSGAN